jgi:2-dehydro-3-deoxygluconokinase
MTAQEPTGLVTFGETMGLVTAAGFGPLQFAPQLGLSIGGAESNVAIGAARLDATVTWFGRVGEDALGDLIAYRLAADGVRALVTRDAGFTGIMIKHRRGAATTRVDYHRAGSAGSRLSPADIPVDVIEQAALLHVTGITPALSGSARETTMAAIETARSAGTRVSLDVNYRSKLWAPAEARACLADVVRKSDIVFAGPAEAAMLLQDDPHSEAEALARQVQALGPSEVIIKDGARGCSAVLFDEAFTCPAMSVPEVDPVGAGDAFVAGYLADALAGATPRERLATAITSGAFAVTVSGDCDGLPSRRDLAQLQERGDVLR